MKKHLITNLFITLLFIFTGCNVKETRPNSSAQNSRTPAPSCLENQQVQQALQAKDLETLAKELLPDLTSQGNCSQEERETLGREVSKLAVAKAKGLLQAGQTEAAEQWLKYPYVPVKLWEVDAILGEIAWRNRDWQGAFVYLDSAWKLLNDPGATPIPPSPEEKQKIADLAMEVQLMEGSLKKVFRGGPKEETTALPVQFVFGKDTLTERGKKSLKGLVEYLQKEKPDHITLVGHTDPVDTDSYNCKLSKRRVEAVKKKLLAAGIRPSQFTVLAKGEQEPFKPHAGHNYTKEEIYQLHRRVEFSLSDGEISDSNVCR